MLASVVYHVCFRVLQSNWRLTQFSLSDHSSILLHKVTLNFWLMLKSVLSKDALQSQWTLKFSKTASLEYTCSETLALIKLSALAIYLEHGKGNLQPVVLVLL